MRYLPLSQLPLRRPARIERIHSDAQTTASLMALGVLEGMPVSIRHVGPFGRDPVVLDLSGHLVSIARSVAQAILVADEEQS